MTQLASFAKLGQLLLFSPSEIKRGAPLLGEYSEEALRGLGYDERLIESLIQDGVVGVPDKDKLG